MAVRQPGGPGAAPVAQPWSLNKDY